MPDSVHISTMHGNGHSRGKMQIGNASRGEVPYLISNDETFRQVGRRMIGHRHAPREQSAIVAAMHLWCRDDRLCVQGESRRLGDPAASSAEIDSSTATRRGESGSTKRAFTTPSRPATNVAGIGTPEYQNDCRGASRPYRSFGLTMDRCSPI
jgi:hypothetical protein